MAKKFSAIDQQLKSIQERCNDHLQNHSAKESIQKQQLVKVLEDHRLEMHLGTAEMVQDIEFANEKELKMFYNYNCSTNRMHHDFKL